MTIQTVSRPRIGVPWRTAREEALGKRPRMADYLRAVEAAGGEPVLMSLMLSSDELKRKAAELDAFLLTGSPADVDPGHFRAKRHPTTAEADPARERTDFTLLEHALATCKPVLAICYGLQTLNVFMGGSLVQDIPSELGSAICHSPIEDEHESPQADPPDPIHYAQFAPGRILNLARTLEVQVKSNHHQSVLEPGGDLRITSHAPDGVVEAVEWNDDSHWLIGVQWHPERMPEDALSQALFRELVRAAETAKK